MKKSWGKRTLSAVASMALVLTSFTGKFPGAKSTKVSADGGTASDGLPIFDDYTLTPFYQDNPLGIPGNFHLFGFYSIGTNDHVNGNLATQAYHKGLGNPSINQDFVGRTLSVISKSIDVRKMVYDSDAGKLVLLDIGDPYVWNLQYNTDVYFPEDYSIVKADGSTIDYPYTEPAGRAGVTHDSFNGHWMGLNPSSEVEAAYAHVNDSFIDFEAERQKAFALSEQFSQLEPTIDVDISQNGMSYELEANKTNVICLKASDLKNPMNMWNTLTLTNLSFENGEYPDKQTVIINIDLEGSDSLWLKSDFIKLRAKNGELLTSSEEAALAQGINVLFNIYGGSEDKTPAIIAEKSIGCYLAPGCIFDARSVNGNIIADHIIVTNETHMSNFRNPVTKLDQIKITGEKKWGDGADAHADGSVKMTLYRTLPTGIDPDDVVGLA